jgi:Cu(I)/Ag(I) efflux system protein CusF
MHAAKILPAILLVAAVAPAWADDMAGMDMPGMTTAQHAGNTQNAPLSEGVIRKIDAAGGRVTLRHGELYNLGMPAMTMAFAIKDKAMLKGYKPGDKVRFRADAGTDGSLMVTQMSHLR